MITEDGFKLILYPKVPKVLLFNLQNDSGEQYDLSEFIERTAIVDVRDGRLTIALGPQLPGNNT